MDYKKTIIVTSYNDVLIPISRSIPLTTTIIVRDNNGAIDPMSALKQRQYGLLNEPPVLPFISQPSFSF